MLIAQFQYQANPNFLLDVDLELPTSGFTIVFGPSGSGKTSFVRCLMGLEHSMVGYVRFRENIWHKKNAILPTHKRSVATVFQDAHLFPHLNVLENLRYAASRAKTLDDINSVVEELLLSHLLKRKPHTLSGGEKKRVAIARALLSKPAMLCMDEPLSGLDTSGRRQILELLTKVQVKRGIPVIYITHAMDEVTYLADYVVVLESGKVVRHGPALDTLPKVLAASEQPSSVIDVTILEILESYYLYRSEFSGQTLYIPFSEEMPVCQLEQKRRVQIFARDVSLSSEPLKKSSILNSFQGVIKSHSNISGEGMITVTVDVAGICLLASISMLSVKRLSLNIGDTVFAHVKAAAFV